jgi:hypothetical protein
MPGLLDLVGAVTDGYSYLVQFLASPVQPRRQLPLGPGPETHGQSLGVRQSVLSESALGAH